MPFVASMSEELISIGKIVAPHGVRGDVRVIPLTDFPERFRKTKRVFCDGGLVLDIENVKYNKQFVLLKFCDVNSMDEAEKLRNKHISLPKEELVKLPKDHYYQFEIIGLNVFSDQDEYLGKVSEILQTGSNDVYVVRKEGCKDLLIPALKAVVISIDVPASKMTVRLQEEWE